MINKQYKHHSLCLTALIYCLRANNEIKIHSFIILIEFTSKVYNIIMNRSKIQFEEMTPKANYNITDIFCEIYLIDREKYRVD